MANRPGTPAAGAGSTTVADRLAGTQLCPAGWAPMGRAARGSSPALGIASVLLPRTPLRTPLLLGRAWAQGTTTPPCSPRAELALAGVWRMLLVLGSCLCSARTLLRHSCSLASSWAVSPAGRLPGAAGGGRKGRDGEGWEGSGGGAAPWPDGEGSSQHCQVLQVASVLARGGSAAGTKTVQVPGPWQRLAPRQRPGKGHGADCRCRIAHRIRRQQRPEWHPSASLPASFPGPAATRGPCKVTASGGPCKALRQREAGA